MLTHIDCIRPRTCLQHCPGRASTPYPQKDSNTCTTPNLSTPNDAQINQVRDTRSPSPDPEHNAVLHVPAASKGSTCPALRIQLPLFYSQGQHKYHSRAYRVPGVDLIEANHAHEQCKDRGYLCGNQVRGHLTAVAMEHTVQAAAKHPDTHAKHLCTQHHPHWPTITSTTVTLQHLMPGTTCVSIA